MEYAITMDGWDWKLRKAIFNPNHWIKKIKIKKLKKFKKLKLKNKNGKNICEREWGNCTRCNTIQIHHKHTLARWKRAKSIINTLTWWKRELKIVDEAVADQAMAADQDRPTSHVDDARARLGDAAPQRQIVGNLLLWVSRVKRDSGRGLCFLS